MINSSQITISQEIIELLELPLFELISLANQSRAVVFGATLEICSRGMNNILTFLYAKPK